LCINSWGCLNIRIIEYAELQTNSDMQRSASDGQQMQQIVQLLQEMNERLKRIESRETADHERHTRNAARRKQYKQEKERRNEGLVQLPDKHVLCYRDARLGPRFRIWAEAGMRFGRADKPEAFCTWLVYHWNSCTYLKKPITFSGSTFRVWTSVHRVSYGPKDLMGFSERRGRVQILRNDNEHDDFRKRPWWDWSYAVLVPVFEHMKELGFEALPERFRRCIRLLVGSFGEYEVLPDLCWDPYETRPNVNLMLKKVGSDLQRMLRAVFQGLRMIGPKEVEIPV